MMVARLSSTQHTRMKCIIDAQLWRSRRLDLSRSARPLIRQRNVTKRRDGPLAHPGGNKAVSSAPTPGNAC